jgi:two-component sensor histidine kinase
MLNLQAAQLEAPEIKSALKDSQLRIQTMALLHEQLYRSQDLARIDFGEHVRELSESLMRFHAVRERAISLELEAVPLSVNLDTAIPLGLLANELITNALKHAYVGRTSGRLLIELAREGSRISLRVADDGIGFPPDFSFDTGKKMGTTLVRALTRQMRGTIEVTRGELNAVQLRIPASEVI